MCFTSPDYSPRIPNGPRSLPRGVAKTRSVTRLWRNPRDCLRKKMRAYRKLPPTRGDQVYAILPTHVSPPRHTATSKSDRLQSDKSTSSSLSCPGKASISDSYYQPRLIFSGCKHRRSPSCIPVHHPPTPSPYSEAHARHCPNDDVFLRANKRPKQDSVPYTVRLPTAFSLLLSSRPRELATWPLANQ